MMKNFNIKHIVTIICVLFLVCGVFCGVFNYNKQKTQNEQNVQKIPKIIHYCWVGPNQMGPLEKKCIESWKKYLPDYEIMEWNNSHLHLIDCPYVRKAYKDGKWSYISDVIRLYALKNYGGIYLDTDTEIYKSLNDFLYLDFFCGFGKWYWRIDPSATPLGAIPNHHIINDLYATYFDNKYPHQEYMLLERFRVYLKTKYSLGPYFKGKETLEIEPGAKIFPYNYFINYKMGVSYAVHHYRTSWVAEFMPIITKECSFKNFTVWTYKRTNTMNDEIIWDKKEKILLAIPTGKHKYIIITKDK